MGGKGLFVTMEGIDGCGKTTQVERLCARLEQNNIPYLRTREPGGTAIGDSIRTLLLDPRSEMTPDTETYLYAAARAEHVRCVILPALAEGKIVVCDRFVDASVAYQGYGMSQEGLTAHIVTAINAHAVYGLWPHLTFVIDVPIEVAEDRLRASNRLLFDGQDRIERRGRAFFERVRQGLREIYEAEPDRVHWLDGTASVDELESQIWASAIQLAKRVGVSPCS